MLTRRWMASLVAAAAFVGASGQASAAERQLLGIVLGRSYRQVLAKFGTPEQVRPVNIPVPGQQPPGGGYGDAAGAYPGGMAGGPPGYGGAPGYGAPAGGGSGGSVPAGPGGYPGAPSYGAPGAGGPGAGYGGPPGYGGLPGYGGPAGGGSGGGPPMLPPVGGAPGAPGYGGGYGADPNQPGAGGLTGVGNGAEWIYRRPGGVNLAFIINEDGRVAQISVSSAKPWGSARTSRGVTLGNDYKTVLLKYGYPENQLVGNQFVETYFTKSHHAAFTFVRGKLVRITIALAD